MKMTGVTVYLVDEGMDTGPVVPQEAVEIRDDDDWDSLELGSTRSSTGCSGGGRGR